MWLEFKTEGRFKSKTMEPVSRSVIMSPFNQFFTYYYNDNSGAV